MALTINTNVMSLNAQRNLGKSQNALANSMQRLSSGLRINSAKDDAAGLAISDRMTAQIRGLNQAARNANDGISLAQTAEGALQESTNILQRIRELAVQSANDTNSDSDRASLNDEVVQLKAELDRIAVTTEFNGRKVIDGSLRDATFQVGANAGTNQTIAFSIDSAIGSELSQLGTTIEAPNGTPVSGANITGPLEADTLTVNGEAVAAAEGATAIAAAINEAAGAEIASIQNVQTIDFAAINLGIEVVTASEVEVGAPAEDAVAAEQTFDFDGLTLAGGESIAFSIGTETYTFTNGSAGDADLTGTDLADAIATDFSSNGVSGFEASADGATLTINQAEGSEAELSAITTTFTYFAEEVTLGVVGTPEVQHFDFSSITIEAGESIVFSIGGSEHTFTNEEETAITGDELATAVARFLDDETITNYSFAEGTGLNEGKLIITGPESDVDPVEVTFARSIGTIVEAGNEASPAEQASQTIDLEGVSIGAGETITFSIGEASYEFTNNGESALTGTGLAAAIASDFATNGVENYTASADEAVLTIAQESPFGAEIDLITASYGGSEYTLSLGETAIDLTAASADGTITAGEVAEAINTDETNGFTAEVNAQGQLVVTQTTATDSFEVSESGAQRFAGETGEATMAAQLVLDSESNIVFEGEGVAAIGLADVGYSTTTIDQISVASRAQAWTAIASVDAALMDIDRIRGGLGAVQNRFESTIANLNNVAENLSAARSRILDADIAMETSAMTKSNILQQAGVAILAQANQTPQLALSLLG
ncbi:flagellin [Desulfofustis limnaeus]|uniref:Flagellin n=1 Tax=Desulfofustis limnaeus TaxID=2740163 RepID=A0ABM7W8X3_9BACT|nr:flagellin [Desulfofustis limnaeus]BDD87368.1 hypothetical protein DPPLL_17330 [Desulfofustis limnaeus]